MGLFNAVICVVGYFKFIPYFTVIVVIVMVEVQQG